MIKQDHDLSIEESEKHEEMFGGFNDAPPNLTEITEKEFAQSKFFIYTPKIIEYRQITQGKIKYLEDSKVLKQDQMLGLTLYFYHGNQGIGLGSDYWEGKVQYFKFYACDHKYDELTQQEARENGVFHAGRCYHVYKCKKCDHIVAYDSSD